MAMARISLDPPNTLSYRIGTRFARRRYGTMLDPGAAVAHNIKVARSYALFELGVERWRALDRGLKDLAIVAVENLRSRINSALGLTAQGFKDRCEVPAAGAAAAGTTAAGTAGQRPA